MWYSIFRPFTRHFLIPVLTLTFLVVATGCDSSSEGPTGPSAPTGPLSFESIEQSHAQPDVSDGEFNDEMVRVVRDENEFESFWEDLKGEGAEAPSVNFSEKLIVAAMLGERPNDGYGADIQSITKNENPTGVRVFVTEIEPGANCTDSGSSAIPYHIVEVDRFATEEVFFVDNGTETRDCE